MLFPLNLLHYLSFGAKLTYLQKLPVWVYRCYHHHSQVEYEPREKKKYFFYMKKIPIWVAHIVYINIYVKYVNIHMYTRVYLYRFIINLFAYLSRTDHG